MTEYTDSPEAIQAWRDQLARTAAWIQRHQDPHIFAPADHAPTIRDSIADIELDPDDIDRYSSKSVPPKMLLRYTDGREDVPIEDYHNGRTHRPAERDGYGRMHGLPTLSTHPQPEQIQIRPSRSSSGNPTPVSARPRTTSYASGAAGPIQPMALSGRDITPPYPQQIAVWKSDPKRISPQTSLVHGGPSEYGAPGLVHSATHPPTQQPHHDPRGSMMSGAPLQVPYRDPANPRSPPLSYTQSNPAHPAAHPAHVSARQSMQGSSRPISPLSAHPSIHAGRPRYDSYVDPRQDYAPTSSSRRGPPKVYSSRATSRSGSVPPPVVYAPRGTTAIDERFDPPAMTSSRAHGHRSRHPHERSDHGHSHPHDREYDRDRGRSRAMNHAPGVHPEEFQGRTTSIGSAVLIDGPSRSRTLSPSRAGKDRRRGSPERDRYRRERSVPRTESSGSTYYVMPSKGQRVHVLHPEDDHRSLHSRDPSSQSHPSSPLSPGKGQQPLPGRRHPGFFNRLFGGKGLSLGSRGDLDRRMGEVEVVPVVDGSDRSKSGRRSGMGMGSLRARTSEKR